MNGLIAHLRSHTVHTPRLALARFLLALGMLLTMLCNQLSIVANHHYTHMEGYTIRHGGGGTNAFAFLDLFMVMPPAVAYWVVVAILVAVMSGFAPRITGILHFIACFSYHNYYIILNGGDDLTLDVALLLLPLCLTDPRSNQWLPPDERPATRNIMANIALLAIQLLASWLYLDAFYPKLLTPQWHDGTAIYYYINHYRLGAPDWLRGLEAVFTNTPVVRVLSWGALLLELLLSLALFYPPQWKRRFILPALFFHLLILINFGLITFFIAIAGLLILYLDANDTYTCRIVQLFGVKGWERK
ncbi:MAG: hypothetical protein EBZ77_01295 [Chitinophagia bacterium]|nr:hypothetical protein [Chitinophagia bacterium]